MSIIFEGQSYSAQEGETVLACLRRHGVEVRSSCESGVCQSCLLSVVGKPGLVDGKAQAGLTLAQKDAKRVLSCQQPAREGLELARGEQTPSFRATIRRVHRSGAVALLELDVPTDALDAELVAGRFVHVVHPNGGFRAYSLANRPQEGHLELHVRVIPGGQISPWLAEGLGRSVELRGPFGSCRYRPEEPEASLLLAGVGTGAAPLLGIVDDALVHGHRGPIQLLLGAKDPASLYFSSRSEELARRGVEVRYFVLDVEPSGADIDLLARGRLEQRPLDQALAQAVSSLTDPGASWITLCGDPTLVHKMRRSAFLAGVGLDRIVADPFAPPR